MVTSVNYLGYVINAQGLRPWSDKVLAIQLAPSAFKCDPTEIVLRSTLLLWEISPKFVFSASHTVQAAGKMFGGNGHLSWSKPSKCLKYCSHLHNYLFISIHSFFSCLVMHLPMALVPCLPTKCLMALHSLLGMFMHTLNFAEHSYS